MSTILAHVIYADQQKTTKTGKPKASFNPLIGTDRCPCPLPMALRPVEEEDPNRFKKIPGEKEQLREMKKEFFTNTKKKYPGITNKQAAKIFTHKFTITT